MQYFIYLGKEIIRKRILNDQGRIKSTHVHICKGAFTGAVSVVKKNKFQTIKYGQGIRRGLSIKQIVGKNHETLVDN